MLLTEIARRYEPEGELPLAGYATLLGIFATAMSAALSAMPRRQLRLGARDILLLGVATFQLTRFVAKDRVLAPVRAPFTEYVGSSGAGEVDEQARGTGLQRAIGELLTCPYCLAPWVVTAVSVAVIASPKKTRWLAGIVAITVVSDVCQQLYAGLRKLSK
ncbi:MAG TPA: DUF1360 domain-containing protein [Polyangiaceae bacterium]|jgi:hypothetical protein